MKLSDRNFLRTFDSFSESGILIFLNPSEVCPAKLVSKLENCLQWIRLPNPETYRSPFSRRKLPMFVLSPYRSFSTKGRSVSVPADSMFVLSLPRTLRSMFVLPIFSELVAGKIPESASPDFSNLRILARGFRRRCPDRFRKVSSVDSADVPQTECADRCHRILRMTEFFADSNRSLENSWIDPSGPTTSALMGPSDSSTTIEL